MALLNPERMMKFLDEKIKTLGRGLHSSTSSLNLSCFCH